MMRRPGRLAFLLALLAGLALVAAAGLPGASRPAQAQAQASPADPPAPADPATAATGRRADTARPPVSGDRARESAATAGLWSRWQRWIADLQHDFSTRLTAAVRALKTERPLSALAALALVSFLYGIVHAVGPGHGKAVIAAYVFANERTLRRGILLAMASSLTQALTAIAAITVLAVLLNATGMRIQAYADRLEQASYLLVALVGGWLVWNGLRRLLAARHAADAPADPRGHGHDHRHDDHGHRPPGDRGHAHGPGCGCGHAHIPAPQQLAEERWNWREAASIVLAIGLRPCSGALIVLVFAWVNGLYWAGIAATFAMAVGTAITISALAVLAVGSKRLALRLYGESNRRSLLLVDAIALAGGLLVLLLGIALFLGSLGPARPFG